MTTLQQVHLKIQEIDKVDSHIPVSKIVHEFGDNDDFIKSQLKKLMDMKFITFANYKGDEIKLTLMGKLSNLP